MSHSPILADLLLSRSATDRSAELRNNPEWIAGALKDPATLFICVNKSCAPVTESDLRFFTFEEIPQDSLTYFLGREGDVAFFGVGVDADFVSTHDPDSWLNLRASGSLLSDRDAGLLVAAVALDNWNSTL